MFDDLGVNFESAQIDVGNAVLLAEERHEFVFLDKPKLDQYASKPATLAFLGSKRFFQLIIRNETRGDQH